MQYDLIIKNATLVDGTGAPAFAGDVAVTQGKIAAVGRVQGAATEVVDATGLHLAPGFIDAHSHGDQALGQPCSAFSKLSQGITTEAVGLCGISSFPLNEAKTPFYSQLMAGIGVVDFPPVESMQGFAAYRGWAEGLPLKVNAACFVGHGNIRMAAMGLENRAPTGEELQTMKALLREAMENGCIGMTSGLIYPPGCFAQPDELAELCKVVAEYGGIYATHMRSEANGILQAVEEAIEVARQSGVHLWISHIKIMGPQNWGGAETILGMVHEAQGQGVKITLDQYPYSETGTSLSVCMPPWHMANGGAGLAEKLQSPEGRAAIRAEMENPETPYENNFLNSRGFGGITVTLAPGCPEAQGKTLQAFAEEQGKDPFDAFFDLMLATGGGGMALYACIGDEDIFRFITDPDVVVGTDGICHSFEERVHPRTFGTFPRAINWFEKQEGLIPLEQMVHKMTGQTAARLGLAAKGVLQPGADADLVLFDLARLCDNFDPAESHSVSDGVEQVYVNGHLAWAGGEMTGENAGRLLAAQNHG